MNYSSVKLFKSVIIPINQTRGRQSNDYTEFLKLTIPYGFVLSPDVVGTLPRHELVDLIDFIKKEMVLSGEQMNSTFQSSWTKIQNATMEQLVLEQIIHYITTYGYNQLGIYNDDSIYIPFRDFDIPTIDIEQVKLVTIKAVLPKDIKDKLLNLLNSGIALHEDTISDVVDLSKEVGFSGSDIQKIKNKEAFCQFCDMINFLPPQPEEFLRYVIYKLTGKTLLIKSRNLLEEIKEAKDIDIRVLTYFQEYDKRYDIKNLASSFYRFKAIFLALKSHRGMASYINKIRKLAIKYHIPMKEDFLNNITCTLSREEDVDVDRFIKELKNVNAFRKVRLAYALNIRTLDNVNSMLYKVRNGKTYVKNFKDLKSYGKDQAEVLLNIIEESIIDDVAKNVKGKKIFIPEGMNYALPATEKQFTGNLPCGSFIELDNDMIFGIHWENVEGRQTDLDLSTLDVSGEKIGWNSYYRSEDLLFSGDVTSAPKPHGATELFYMKNKKDNCYLLYVNYYNFDEELPVPFKIIVGQNKLTRLPKNYMINPNIVGQNKLTRLPKNYMINPNHVKAIASTKIERKQMYLGFASVENGKCRFYFNAGYIGNRNISDANVYTDRAIEYMKNMYTNPISLNDILELSGAEIVNEMSEDVDINLSLHALEKDSIISLLT